MNARRLPDVCKNTQQMYMQGSLLAFFHLCLVSVLFSGPSLTEMQFYRSLLSLVSVLFGGVSKPCSKQKTNGFIVLEMNTFCVGGTNKFCASDECFSTGDERIENVHSNLTPPPTHTATYVATSDFQIEFVLRLLLSTPTSCIHNSILCWTKRPSSRLS